jgi:hypothetical protein
MAHFAELGMDNIVQRVIVVHNNELLDADGVEQESLGIDFCRSLFPSANWKQTSYNGSIRKNFAGVGFTYDGTRDAFIPPKPFESWVLNETTCLWDAPVAMPDDGNRYTWNEETTSWDLVTE